MKKSQMILTSLAVVVLLSSTTFAASVSWTATGAGDLWADAANWNYATYPGETTEVHTVYIRNGYTANLQSDIPNPVGVINLGASSTGELNMTAGSLSTGDINVYGTLDKEGLITISGGTLTSSGTIKFGAGSNASAGGNLAMSGGTVNAATLNFAGAGNNTAKSINTQSNGAINATTMYVGSGTNSIGEYTMTGGTITVGTLSVAGAGTGSALLDINGGSVTTTAAGMNVSGTGVLKIQSGSLNMAGNLGQAMGGQLLIQGGTVDLNGNQVVNSTEISGGTITQVSQFGNSQTMTGGTVEIGSTAGVASSTYMAGYVMTFTTGGKFIFDATADSTNDYLTGHGAGRVDFQAGSEVQMAFDAGYTPQVGDSFDLIQGVGTTTPGNASILTTSADGNWNVTWDTSAWESDGILTISGITPIPEPATLSLLAFGGLAMLCRRRRASA